MLVLTRRKNQSIVINDDIVVTVLEVKGDQIRLGITAPRHVQVYREELLVALTDANRSAVLAPDAELPAAEPRRPRGPPCRRTAGLAAQRRLTHRRFP